MNKEEYTKEKDLKEIKKQIKEWEKEIDMVVDTLNEKGYTTLAEQLDGLSHDMMAINI